MATKFLDYTGLSYFWAKIKALITSVLPTKTSDLTNDSGFIEEPSSGTTGQVLKKTASGVEWANESGGISDVQINGTSVTSNGVANIVTQGTYNASTNKVATMSDLPSTSGLESTSNKVTSLSSSSTDTQYPSAKVVYDQLATKQATLVSGTNIKTINSTSLLGTGDLALALQSQGISSITTQQDGSIVFTFANGDTTTVDLNHTHPNYYKKTAETSLPSGGMLPDVVYSLGTLTGATTFTFAAAVSGNLNHYYFRFTSGSTAVVPTWPASITAWDGNCVDSDTGLPVIAASKTYEVSVIDGNAFIKEW